jgi:hypothetical protein
MSYNTRDMCIYRQNNKTDHFFFLIILLQFHILIHMFCFVHKNIIIKFNKTCNKLWTFSYNERLIMMSWHHIFQLLHCMHSMVHWCQYTYKYIAVFIVRTHITKLITSKIIKLVICNQSCWKWLWFWSQQLFWSPSYALPQ